MLSNLHSQSFPNKKVYLPKRSKKHPLSLFWRGFGEHLFRNLNRILMRYFCSLFQNNNQLNLLSQHNRLKIQNILQNNRSLILILIWVKEDILIWIFIMRLWVLMNLIVKDRKLNQSRQKEVNQFHNKCKEIIKHLPLNKTRVLLVIGKVE